MKRQMDLVVEYMKNHGSITKKEAYAILRIVNLSAVLSDLRKEGFPVKTYGGKGRKKKGEARETRWSLMENMEEMVQEQSAKTESNRVLEYMQKHETMTADDASDFLDIKRVNVAPIIRNLKRAGISIHTIYEKDVLGRHKNKIARYSLTAKKTNTEEAGEKFQEEAEKEYCAESSCKMVDSTTRIRGVTIASYMEVRKEMIGRQQDARFRVEMGKFWNEHTEWSTEYELGIEDGYLAAMDDVVEDIERMIMEYKKIVKDSEEKERQYRMQHKESGENKGEEK